jgi:hypothetical protein
MNKSTKSRFKTSIGENEYQISFYYEADLKHLNIFIIYEENELPNARAIIPCSSEERSATSAGHALGCILSVSIKPESRCSICH